LTIADSIICHNEAGDNGGGIFANSNSVSATRSTVSDNRALGKTQTAGVGGGIQIIGDLTLTECTVSGNRGIDGGAGIHSSEDSNVKLSQCTVSENIASLPESTGGGLYADSGTMTLTHCTLSGNHANSGGGIYTEAVNLTLINCILTGRTGLDVDLDGTTLVMDGKNIVHQGIIRAISDGTGLIITDPAHLITADPLLAPLGSNGGPTRTHNFLAGSPAIDAGDNAFATAFSNDQRGSGFARIVNGNSTGGMSVVDIGSYELQQASDIAAPSGIFSQIPLLSQAAKDSLVAHFDGRKNIVTNVDGAVELWTPVDGAGNTLPMMALSTVARPGGGDSTLISYEYGTGTLNFAASAIASEGRYLSGTLTNAGGTEMTVIWQGHYDAGNPGENSGAYAFNIGLNSLSHQRDDFGGGFTAELYNGTTYPGTVDITPFDGIDTVWTTSVTANSHVALAGGTNLNIQGNPSYNFGANAEVVIGAFDSSGFGFVGDMKQLIIFESQLTDDDQMLVRNYLEAGFEPTLLPPPNVSIVDGMIEVSWTGSNVVVQRSSDLMKWTNMVCPVSPLRVPLTSRPKDFFRVVGGTP
jgi:hypothetical protein